VNDCVFNCGITLLVLLCVVTWEISRILHGYISTGIDIIARTRTTRSDQGTRLQAMFRQQAGDGVHR
jgi:hypothetical protein